MPVIEVSCNVQVLPVMMAKMGCIGPLDLQVTIGTLPDDALVEVFDFYVHQGKPFFERWYTLVHVCRRWRSTPSPFAPQRDL